MIATLTGGPNQTVFRGSVLSGTYDLIAWVAGHPISASLSQGNDLLGFEAGGNGGIGYWYGIVPESTPTETGILTLDNVDTEVTENLGNIIVSISPGTLLSLSSVSDGDAYFATKLNVRAWTGSSSPRKQAALNDATRIINRFRYISCKVDSNQSHEWPRINLGIPEDILIAQYEIAFALLQGKDPEREIRSAYITSRGVSSVRTSYDTRNIPVFISLGVPSAVAWQYLLHYFSNPRDIHLNRIS